MTKYEYLTILERRLAKLPNEEKQEVMRDYEEHFLIAGEAGKTDAMIIDELGPVEKLAKEIAAEYRIELAKNSKKAGNLFSAVLAVGALGFFNLIFVLGPAMAVFSILFSFWVVAITFVISPVAFLLLSLTGLSSFTLFELFNTLVLCGIGIFVYIGTMHLTKWVKIITMKYLSFNLKIIRGGQNNE